MKKIIKLTESDLRRLVKRAINEAYDEYGYPSDVLYNTPKWDYDRSTNLDGMTNDDIRSEMYFEHLQDYISRLPDDEVREIARNEDGEYTENAASMASDIIRFRKHTPEHQWDMFNHDKGNRNEINRIMGDYWADSNSLEKDNGNSDGYFAMSALDKENGKLARTGKFNTFQDRLDAETQLDPNADSGYEWYTYKKGDDDRKRHVALSSDEFKDVEKEVKYYRPMELQGESRNRNLVNRITESIIRRLRR